MLSSYTSIFNKMHRFSHMDLNSIKVYISTFTLSKRTQNKYQYEENTAGETELCEKDVFLFKIKYFPIQFVLNT